MFDAIIISDIHLGSKVSQTKLLHNFLQSIISGDRKTKELIINGDVFDSMDLRRLNRRHWRILSDLRKLSDSVHITWIGGNHDGAADQFSHLLGVDVTDEYIFESGGIKMLAFHGDRFDQFITDHPVITNVADFFYGILQKIDRSFYVARQAKRASKTFLRCSAVIEEEAIEYAKTKQCKVVFCGHTHLEITRQSNDVSYYNSGCWTEVPCSYISVKDGEINLRHFKEEDSTKF